MISRNYIGAKVKCNGPYYQIQDEFKQLPHQQHKGIGHDIWPEDQFEREYVARLKMFYGIMTKQIKSIEGMCEEMIGQIIQLKETLTDNVFDKFCELMCRKKADKLFSKIMMSLIMPPNKESQDLLTCSDMAEFLQNLAEVQESSFKERTKSMKEQACLKIQQVVSEKMKKYGRIQKKAIIPEDLSVSSILKKSEEQSQSFSLDFSNGRNQRQQQFPQQKSESTVIEVQESESNLFGTRNFKKEQKQKGSKQLVKIEKKEPVKIEPKQMTKSKFEKKKTKNYVQKTCDGNCNGYIKVRDLDLRKEKPQFEKKKFSIKLKVIKILLFRLHESHDEQKKYYHRYSKVKFVGGDQTGLVVCFTDYRLKFSEGDILMIHQASFKNFQKVSYEIEAFKIKKQEGDDMNVNKQICISDMADIKSLDYSIQSWAKRWKTLKGIARNPHWDLKKLYNGQRIFMEQQALIAEIVCVIDPDHRQEEEYPMKYCEIADNTASIYAYIITTHELKKGDVLYLKNMLVVRQKDGIFMKTAVRDKKYEQPDFVGLEFKFPYLSSINAGQFLWG